MQMAQKCLEGCWGTFDKGDVLTRKVLLMFCCCLFEMLFLNEKQEGKELGLGENVFNLVR